jgi:hypothetical protein
MASGLADRVWTIDEIVERSDAFRASRVAEESGATLSADTGEDAPFWVNHSPYHRRAKVHAATCTTRNKALVSDGNAVREVTWSGFSTEEEALEFAERLEPDHSAICRRCLGSYVTLSSYGRRR